ncbi:DUF4192 domain-containing protein [Streptomyces sp. SID3343]|uniref:DUF4192 domain-containing protein n=1 Tax=Streptomyces sp. SID3343 TaxID=2690260 RepID=UPI001369877A|nr:DUF4192 domain-containing protein [Streptomyces sp. SID3343]MYV99826.1 DUF4192 family protein [Streptomyces sp. SID3343]
MNDTGGIDETSFTSMTPQSVLRVRSPADLVEAVPYLIGVRPTDSVVLLGILPGERSRVGPVLRHDLPPPADHEAAALHFARLLGRTGAHAVAVAFYADTRPDGRETSKDTSSPTPGEGAAGLPAAVERHRSLHEALVRECGRQAIEVREAVCVTAGRWWSYGCVDARCCPPEGTPLRTDRSSTVAATAVWAGLPEPVALADLVRRFRPPEYALREVMIAAFARVRADPPGFAAERTLASLAGHRARFRSGDTTIEPEEAARLVLGLGDARVRDEVMGWHGAEPPTDDPTLLRLWTTLARRAFAPASAAPLTLAAWAAWTVGDGVLARVAVTAALRADGGYTMAGLLHSAINSPLSAADVRRRIFRDAVTNRAP